MATFGPEKYELGDGRVVVFRHCSGADAPVFPDFRKQVASETTNTLQYVGQETVVEKTRDLWRQSESDEVTLTLGAFDGNRLIGLVGFRPFVPGHHWVRHVGQFGMMILKDYWGGGVGRRMLSILNDHAKKTGILKIEALVRVKNERGLKLYLQSGYQIEGTRKKAALINGHYEDEFYITKHLNGEASDWVPPRLSTERLLLRPIVESDAQNIFEYARNPAVSRYTLWEPPKTISDTLIFINDYVFPYYRRQEPEPFGITLSSSPETVVGTIGCFWNDKFSKSMELAYALAESHWGKGIAAEAARCVIDYVFREYPTVRIQARCKVANVASIRILEKVGMKFEGTLRASVFHRDRSWDMSYYSILREELKG